MDRPAALWYFSTMAPLPRAGGPRTVAFHRAKYGRELLVDAGFLRRLPGFDFTDRPYALAFYDLLLVTRGRGTFVLDDRAVRVAPGTLLFTRPGEVRRLQVKGLDGACLFFAEEFVAETFADPRFLDRFACFRAKRPSPSLALGASRRRLFLSAFRSMQREIAALRDDATDALRAKLYEILVLADRWYGERWGSPMPLETAGAVERFRDLLEARLYTEHRVTGYARAVGLTAGHLSALCRRQTGRSAGAHVRDRLALEAKRLLLYTDMTAAQVADRLGFDDPAYFARFFKREAGAPPSVYRARNAASGRDIMRGE
jgi:AraC-like DNA-binding protein